MKDLISTTVQSWKEIVIFLIWCRASGVLLQTFRENMEENY